MRQAAEQGARFYACSQSLQEYGIAAGDLIPEVHGIAGAVTYMARCMDDEWVALVY